jgi:hypothetical protein
MRQARSQRMKVCSYYCCVGSLRAPRFHFLLSINRTPVCLFADFTDKEEPSSDAESEGEDKDEDAAHVVYKRDERVRGESDDDSDASDESEQEPEVEEQPWFVPDGYQVCQTFFCL